MSQVSILTNQVNPDKGEVCTRISKYRLSSLTPVIAFQAGNTGIAEFANLSESIKFCQVFQIIEVDGFTVKLPVMPKYRPMPERGMIKRPLSLKEAREQMILLSEN